jgi:hypothetical protein
MIEWTLDRPNAARGLLRCSARASRCAPTRASKFQVTLDMPLTCDSIKRGRDAAPARRIGRP